MHSEPADVVGAAPRSPRQARGVEERGPDRVEFGEWVKPSLLTMTRVARRLAPAAEAEDVVQDALLRAWRKWDQFDPDRGSPTVWLVAIVVDQARTARVRGGRRRKVIDDGASVPETAGPDASDGADVDLDRALTVLTERRRTAVELHYFVGLTVVEVAVAMACSVGTVRSTLFAARRRMSKVLGGNDA